MKTSIKLAFWVGLCSVALWNVVGFGVRIFLEPRLLSASTEYQLYIHLSSTVHDFPSANPGSLSLGFNPNVWGVDQGLRAAADEPKISSALIHLDNVRLTISQAHTVGKAVKYFRSKGKKVVCYSASFDSVNGAIPAYLLASYCDAIQLQRLGSVSLETLKYDHVLGEDDTSGEVQSSAVLTKIDIDTKALIRANRNSILGLQEPIINDKHYIDTQALNAGLIDSVVARLTQSDYTIVIQDYVRLLEKDFKNKANVVAVVPITEAIGHDVLKEICARSDIQAVVIHLQAGSGVDYAAQKTGLISNDVCQKPVITYVAGLEVLEDKQQDASLNDAIDKACKLAALSKHTVRVEVVHPGSWVSHIMNDLLRLGKSSVSMFKRSLNYVTQRVYVAE
ncbi:MAG: hypothetical protein Q8Q56_00755 [Alphaproteobacteria bacterium]|nr:hypothetical protein [Alphaproteobacteria bacterium]